MSEPMIHEPARELEILRDADLVVCGGGPAGIAAALGAARNGAKTLLLEQYGFLGGTATMGGVSSFAYGFHDKRRFLIGGVFAEIRDELHRRKALIKTARYGWEPFHPEVYKSLLLELLAGAGVDILLHTWISDAVMARDALEAVIVESKAGRQAVTGRFFVDATGDADVAFRAGLPCTVGRSESDHAVQAMTLMYYLCGVDIHKTGEFLAREGRRGYWKDENGEPYLNATGFQAEIVKARAAGDLTIQRDHVASLFTVPWLEGVVGVNFGRIMGITPLDPASQTAAATEGRRQIENGIAFLRKYVPGFEKATLLSAAPQVGVRETRRITGDYELTDKDLLACTQFEDVVAQACYMIDVHQPDSDKTILTKLEPGTHYDIPYRCLLPQGVRNLYAAGRCISASHLALSSTRVQAICMALGQAAGTAAALVLRDGKADIRGISVHRIQEQLRADGAILE